MNDSKTAAVVARLEGVITAGAGRWYARCPAHEDRSPSLSISTGDDGRVLLHCFTGCSVDEIRQALGLRWADLFPDDATRDYRVAIALRLGKPPEPDPLEIERWILRIAAADLETGKALSVEDRARTRVAQLRIAAAQGRAA